MKPVFGVIFRPDTPINLTLFGATPFLLPDGTETLAMNCTEVRETNYGFLQLVPKSEDGKPRPTIYVSPLYILWMLRADDSTTLGFLPTSP